MSNQSPSQVRVIDPILSQVARGYRNARFINSRLFPRVPVMASGGQIIEFGKEAWELYNSRRAPGSGTKRISFGYLGKKYATENHSLEGQVPREHQRDASAVPGIDLAERAVRLTMGALELGLEVQAAKLALDADLYPADQKKTLSGTSQWSHADSDPVKEVEDAKEVVRSKIGQEPNVLTLSAKGFSALKTNKSIIDRLKYTGRDSVTAEMLAGLFDIEEVIVGRGVYNSESGVTDIWGNSAIVSFTPANPVGREEPSSTYTYELEGHPLVEQPYYDNNTKSWIYPVAHERVPEIVGIDAMFLINGVKGS